MLTTYFLGLSEVTNGAVTKYSPFVSGVCNKEALNLLKEEQDYFESILENKYQTMTNRFYSFFEASFNLQIEIDFVRV